MVKIATGKDREVYDKVVKLGQVQDATLVYGECDLVLKVQIKDFNDLDSLIFDTLRRISGVLSTKTLIGTRTT